MQTDTHENKTNPNNYQKHQETGRGRDAKSPTEIPPSGWKDTLLRIKTEIDKDNIAMMAAAMSYYLLFAMVPALTSLVLIYAWVSDPAGISQHLSSVSHLIPSDLLQIIDEQLSSLSSKGSARLGFGVIFSLAVALWSSSKGSKSLIVAMNVIYDEKEERGFIKKNALAVGMTLLGIILGIVAIGVVAGLPALFSQFDLNSTLQLGVTAVSWLILLSLFSFFLSFAYRFGPDRKRAKWKWVSVGAITAAVLWATASAGFSWYVTEFGNFNKTYGSLGAVIVLMMWFYISSFVILMGGEINAELEHQTARDSTVGREKPMGQRDAYVADSVGESSLKH